MPSPIVVIDLLKSALRKKGIIATGETPSAEQATDALRALNDVLETWSIEPYAVYGSGTQTFAIVPGKASYTVGPGGDWDTERPTVINSMVVTFSTVDFPVSQWTLAEYLAVPIKYLQGPTPERFVFINDSPLATVTFYATPAANATVTVDMPRLLTQVMDVNQTITLPPAYARALQYAVAEEVGPEYGSPIDLSAQARSTLALLKRANRQSPIMGFDSSLIGRGAGSSGAGAFVGTAPPDQWSETQW